MAEPQWIFVVLVADTQPKADLQPGGPFVVGLHPEVDFRYGRAFAVDNYELDS